MDNKTKILILLGALLALSFIYRILNPYEQARISQLTYTGEKTSATKKKSTAPKNKLNHLNESLMDLFQATPNYTGEIKQNIFFKTVGRQATVEKEMPPIKSNENTSPEKTPPPPDPRQAAMDELSQYRIFGAYEKDGDMALFLEKGNYILTIREGDRIADQFQVKKLSQTKVTLKADRVEELIHINLKALFGAKPGA